MPIVVTGRHRPHEIVFLIFSLLVGAAFLLGLKPPSSLEQLVAPWILWTWYVLLALSGAIGLVGFLARDLYRELVLERAAMVGQVAAPTLYGLGLLGAGNPAAVFAAGFFVAWALASGWRLWQVTRAISAIRQAEAP